MKQDFYYWRLFATGFCFAMFGIGGVVIGVFIAPAMAACIWNRERRHRSVRRLIHYGFKAFVALMKYLGVLTYDFRGRERLTVPGELVIATHRTLIDVVFLVSCIPNAVCVVKHSLFRSFAFGGLVRGAGYISNIDPQLSLQGSIDALQAGATLVIFPEGTRTNDDARMRLQRGAAYVAMATHTDLTPVRITCTPISLTKSERWYEIPLRRMHFVICVGDKIAVGSAAAASKHVAARAITDRVRHYFLEDTALYE